MPPACNSGPAWADERGVISKVKYFLKPTRPKNLISAKSRQMAQLLAAGLKFGRSVDSFVALARWTRSLSPPRRFPATLFALFYHLGTSCYSCLVGANRCYDRIPDAYYLFFNPYVVQNSGINGSYDLPGSRFQDPGIPTRRAQDRTQVL